MPARCDSAKVKKKMQEAHLTTRKLIEESGLSESTIRRILSEKDYATTDATLDILAERLHCSPYDLLTDEEIGAMVQRDINQAAAEVAAQGQQEAYQMPPALNVVGYVNYIRQTTNTLTSTMARNGNLWRNAAAVLFVLLLVIVVYFLWEIFNPQMGITSILWNVYNTTTPPVV